MARIAAVALATGAILFGLKANGVPWFPIAIIGPLVYGLLLVVTRSVDLGYLKAAVEAGDDADEAAPDPVVPA
jgi:hypothetical protein